MCPILDMDFTDVPDKIEPIPPGTYILEVATVPEIKRSKEDTGNNLHMTFRVADESKHKGRQQKDTIFLNEMGLVKAKQLIIGLGMTAGKGVNTEEMLGRKVKALIIASTYKDKDSGETLQSSKVKSYLKP